MQKETYIRCSADNAVVAVAVGASASASATCKHREHPQPAPASSRPLPEAYTIRLSNLSFPGHQGPGACGRKTMGLWATLFNPKMMRDPGGVEEKCARMQ